MVFREVLPGDPTPEEVEALRRTVRDQKVDIDGVTYQLRQKDAEIERLRKVAEEVAKDLDSLADDAAIESRLGRQRNYEALSAKLRGE